MPTQEAEVKALANRMTNWQRSQWARAGYPGAPRAQGHSMGKREADPDTVRPFTELKRDG